MEDNNSFGSFNQIAGKNPEKEIFLFSQQIIEYKGDSSEPQPQEGTETNPKIVLVSYPQHLEHEGGLRRMGSEAGPGVIHKVFAGLPYKKVPGVTVLNALPYCGIDPHNFQIEQYISRLKNIQSKFSGKLLIGIGGGANFIDPFLKSLENPLDQKILKISPILGLSDKYSRKINDNYLSYFLEHSTLQSKNSEPKNQENLDFKKLDITHIGLIGDLLVGPESLKAQELGHKMVQLDEIRKQEFDISNHLSTEKKSILLLDCEIFSPEFFVGVSSPNTDGFSLQESLQFFDQISKKIDQISSILFVNFNPTVESVRSGNYLSSFIYRIASKISQ